MSEPDVRYWKRWPSFAGLKSSLARGGVDSLVGGDGVSAGYADRWSVLAFFGISAVALGIWFEIVGGDSRVGQRSVRW
jgi:hypothetical protein